MPYRLRRGYSRPTLLPCPSASTGPAAPRRITPRFLSFSGHCHEQQPPPDSRPVSVAAGGKPPNKRLLPISAAHPTIDVMQSSRAQRVYSPLPLRLRLHNAGYCPTCAGWRQLPAGLRYAVAVSGSGLGRPSLTCWTQSNRQPACCRPMTGSGRRPRRFSSPARFPFVLCVCCASTHTT